MEVATMKYFGIPKPKMIFLRLNSSIETKRKIESWNLLLPDFVASASSRTLIFDFFVSSLDLVNNETKHYYHVH